MAMLRLSMIVKNEAKMITQALLSTKEHAAGIQAKL